MARLLGRNVLAFPHVFRPDIRMWVFEEEWEDGRKLTDVINREHENPKYLPGVCLPDNVVALPDLEEAARDASIIVFVLPHQFLGKREHYVVVVWWVCQSELINTERTQRTTRNSAAHPPFLRAAGRAGRVAHQGTDGLIKALGPSPHHLSVHRPRVIYSQALEFDNGKPLLISDVIREGLGRVVSDVCVLMGANVADEVARDEVMVG